MSPNHWVLIGITVGPSLALVIIVWLFCRLVLRICKLHSRVVENLNDTVIDCDVGGKGQP